MKHKFKIDETFIINEKGNTHGHYNDFTARITKLYTEEELAEDLAMSRKNGWKFEGPPYYSAIVDHDMKITISEHEMTRITPRNVACVGADGLNKKADWHKFLNYTFPSNQHNHNCTFRSPWDIFLITNNTQSFEVRIPPMAMNWKAECKIMSPAEIVTKADVLIALVNPNRTGEIEDIIKNFLLVNKKENLHIIE